MRAVREGVSEGVSKTDHSHPLSLPSLTLCEGSERGCE